MNLIPMATVWEEFFNNLGTGLSNLYNQIFSIVFIVSALLLLLALLVSTLSQDEKKSQTAKAWAKRIAVALVLIVMLFTLINFGYSFLKESTSDASSGAPLSPMMQQHPWHFSKSHAKYS